MDRRGKFFLFRIVFRFLFRSQDVGVLPWLTVFALLSIAVGVATLVITLAVMNGFSMTLQEQLVGIYSPLRVYTNTPRHLDIDKLKKKLEDRDEVTQTIGVIQGEVLFKTKDEQYQGGRVMAFTDWKPGRLPLDQPPEEGLYLGQMLARSLWLIPGDEVIVIHPGGQQTPFGILPGGEKMKLKDTLETGFQDVDQFLGLVSVDTARRLFSVPEGKVSYGEIWIKDRFKANQLKQELEEKFSDDYRLVTWIEANPAIFEALKMEEKVYFVVLVLIVLVAAINILSMMVLSILQRRKQIAMMMSMGAGPKTILTLFLSGGLLITSLGILLGFGLGLTGAYLLENVFVFRLPAAYPMTNLPINVRYLHLLWIALVSLGIGFVSSFYPAWEASKIDPAEVLRYG